MKQENVPQSQQPGGPMTCEGEAHGSDNPDAPQGIFGGFFLITKCRSSNPYIWSIWVIFHHGFIIFPFDMFANIGLKGNAEIQRGTWELG